MKTGLRRALAVAFAVVCTSTPAWAQQAITITGQVRSDNGAPLVSASVYVSGLGIGTLSRPDGRYSLNIPASRFRDGQRVQLAAQLLGYATKSVAMTLRSGPMQQDFELTIGPLRLDEIVATGEGTQVRAVALGNARANVSAADITRAADVNLVQALAGRVSGVVTTQQGGEPGASTAILIRGMKTITGTGQPTIVVDGVVINNATRITGASILQGGVAPNRAADINPEDIESMEILKGPAAASIYGASAGTAGAILITTKRGRPGQTTFTLTSNSELNKPSHIVPLQRMYAMGYRKAGATADGDTLISSACSTTNCSVSANFFSWGPPVGQTRATVGGLNLTPTTAAGTYDHASELYTTGHSYDNTLAISGGSEKTTFYLSLGASNQNGYIVGNNDAYKRYTVRLNGSHQLLENLTVGGSATYVQTAGSFIERGNTVNGLLLGALRTPPDFNNEQYLDPTTGLHRTFRFPLPGPTAITNARFYDNPFYSINQDKNTATTGRFFGNVNAKWMPLAWLNVNWTLGSDYSSDDRLEAFAVSSAGAAAGGTVERWQFYDRSTDNNLTASAKHTLFKSIEGTFTVGQSMRQTYFRQVDVLGRTLIAPQPFKIANTVTRDPPSDNETKTRLIAYFAQADLGFGDELFLTGGIRNDANSTFSTNKNSAWYPKAQASWVFTKRLGLPENIINFGKLRFAFGQTGQAPNAYQLQDIFLGQLNPFLDFNPGSLMTPLLNGFGGLYTNTTKGNPDIHPERNTEVETGLDFTLFKGHSDVNLTYYNEDARDVIYSVPLSPSTGFRAQPKNAARITNKGLELGWNVRPLDRPKLGLELGVMYARNRNHVVSLGDTLTTLVGFSSSFVGATTNVQVGQPIGVFRGFDFARCGQGLTTIGTSDIATACQGAPAGALFIASNGFPVQNPNEMVIGNPNPDWTGSFDATLRVHGVTVTALVEHRQGGETLDLTRASLLQFGTARETEIRFQKRTFGTDYYQGPTVGPGKGTAVRLDDGWWGGLGGNNGPKAQFMEDATFTRLREVTLAYTFRQQWLERSMGVSSIDARLSGRNLKTWTNYMGFDPEPNLAGEAAGNRGIDWFVNPIARAYVLSLSIHR